jgi:hypothetical protein
MEYEARWWKKVVNNVAKTYKIEDMDKKARKNEERKQSVNTKKLKATRRTIPPKNATIQAA